MVVGPADVAEGGGGYYFNLFHPGFIFVLRPPRPMMDGLASAASQGSQLAREARPLSLIQD